MIQLYLLSVLCNAAVGAALLAVGERKEYPHFPWSNETFRLGLGVLSLVVGVLKIFSPVGGGVPFFGDLLPALAGITGGFALILGFYREHSDIESDAGSWLGDLVDRHRSLLGFGALVTAALHFFVPRLPLF